MDPGGIRHGPYWLRAVSAGDYQPVTRAEVAQALEQWARQNGILPGSLDGALETTLLPR